MDVFPDIIKNESENDDKNFVLKKIIIDTSCSKFSRDPDKYKFYNSAIEHILINQFPEHNTNTKTKTNTITNLIKLQKNNHAHYILMDVSGQSNPFKTIYGFCSIQSDKTTKVLYRTENPNDGIEHICLWNVAKQPGLMSRGGICSMMLKMIKTYYNTYGNTPIFFNGKS